MNYTKSLDGFRGVAALLVVAVHFNDLFGLKKGGFGVDMFFVLSGFLITSILVEEIKNTGRISLVNFYARRGLRLFPALLTTVVVFCAIDLVFGLTETDRLLKSAAATLLYVVNWVRAFSLWHPAQFGHTWSLAIEEQFYLIWPFMILLFMKLTNTRTALLLTIGVILLIWLHRYNLIIDGVGNRRIGNGFDTRADGIFFGCAASLLAKSYPAKDVVFRKTLVGAGPVAVIVLVAALLAPSQYAAQIPLLQIVYAASAVIVLYLVYCERTALSSYLSADWLVWTGKRSYGIYLYHYPIWYLSLGTTFSKMFPQDVKQFLGLFVLLPLTLVFAWLSYKYIETPALNLKHRFQSAKPYSHAGSPRSQSA